MKPRVARTRRGLVALYIAFVFLYVTYKATKSSFSSTDSLFRKPSSGFNFVLDIASVVRTTRFFNGDPETPNDPDTILFIFIKNVDSVIGPWNVSQSRYKASSGLNIVNVQTSHNGSETPPFPCAQTQIANLRFPICLYSIAEDQFVSAKFHAGGYWEADTVGKVVEFLRKDPSLGFIDIGANVGSYSLPAVAIKRWVVAVEPNWETIRRLAASIRLGGLADRVALLNNAVSDIRVANKMGTHPKNRGHTYVSECAESKGDVLCSPDTVRTVLLDDLSELIPTRRAVLKLDIQCAELRALNRSTSTRFFTNNHIPMILMEWECFKPGFRPDLAAGARELIEYFLSMNYSAHSVVNGERLSVEEWRVLDANEVILLKN